MNTAERLMFGLRRGLDGRSRQPDPSLPSLRHFPIKLQDTKTESLESHGPPLVQLHVMAVCPVSSICWHSGTLVDGVLSANPYLTAI